MTDLHPLQKQMHVLLIHQAFAALDEPGGTRHIEMAQHFIRSGHQVTVITSPISYLTGEPTTGDVHWVLREEPQPGLHILKAYVYPALHRSFFHRLLNFLSFMFSSFFIGLGVKNVTVVWGTSPPIFQAWTAWVLARLKGVKLVLEIRDLWPAFAVAVNVLKNPLLITLSTWLEKFLYTHTDQLVVNSPGFISHIHSMGGRDIALVPNGVNPEMINPHESGARFRIDQGFEGKFIVLYAGAHGVSNDLGVVLEAARLTASDSRIIYLLLGDGKEKPNLKVRARELALNNVIFLAPIPKKEMNQILAAADTCVAILKPVEMYKTTYPNKVFDYMASAKPVLCVIDGVIRQVIEEADAGIYVPPGNAQALADSITQLSKNPEESRNMGINGREYVLKHFNREKLSGFMEELLLKESK